MRPRTREAYQLFHDASLAFADMEAIGIRIDTAYTEKAILGVENTIKEATEDLKKYDIYQEWQNRWGSKMNLTSDKQLGTVLEGMGFTIEERTAGGQAKVDEKSLESIEHPFIKAYLAIKKQNKSSVFLKGILRETDQWGYLHPSYNLASDDDEGGGAASYRGSCSDPNFQTMPKRNKLMEKLIRQAFIPSPGNQLRERDFSGIEVRISVAYNKDPKLMAYIKDPKGGDMHRDTACDLFMLKQSEVEGKTTRDSAKNQFVFPQFYGSVYFKCARPIWDAMVRRDFRVGKDGITIRQHLANNGIKELGLCDPKQRPVMGTFEYHVQQVEKLFWQDRFKVYTQWKQKWWEDYLERGYFDLYTGFRCQGLYRKNQVLNYAIQGSSFHCLLWSILEINKEIKKYKLKSRIVGQIHDSLISDTPPNETQTMLDIEHEVMSVRLPKAWTWINVPIETEAEVCPIGESWYKKEKWGKKGDFWAPSKL